LPSSEKSSDGHESPGAAKSGQGDGDESPGAARAAGKRQPLTLCDNHSVWQSEEFDHRQAEETIRDLLHSVIFDVEPDLIPQYVQQTLQDVWDLEPAQTAGNSSKNDKYRLKGNNRGELAWVRLLRRYVGSCLVVSPDFARPPRRFPKLVGIVPGKRRRGGRPKVMAVIDTSGSITPDLLERIDAEIAYLAQDYRVTVVECDVAIQRVYPYKRIQEVLGLGGTDLRPPFERQFLGKHKPDLIIYFTDGEGPAPDSPPNKPVVWCLTPGGQAPCDWGRVIKMQSPEPK